MAASDRSLRQPGVGRTGFDRRDPGQWQGLNPRLDLASVQVHDGAADAVLTLPKVSAVLAWRSILTLSPRLLQLRLDQPELNLRRDAQNRLWVAGMAIDLNDQGGPRPGWSIPRCAG